MTQILEITEINTLLDTLQLRLRQEWFDDAEKEKLKKLEYAIFILKQVRDEAIKGIDSVMEQHSRLVAQADLQADEAQQARSNGNKALVRRIGNGLQ